MFVDDFDNLMREQYSARRAAYHLREWVWHDLIENNQKLKDGLKITSVQKISIPPYSSISSFQVFSTSADALRKRQHVLVEAVLVRDG
jgi:hypothetical protein